MADGMDDNVVKSVETALAIPVGLQPAERKTAIKSIVSQLSMIDDLAHVYTAQLLWEIKQQQYFLEWGFANFQSYADSELQFSARKAYDLVKVYEKFHVELGMSAEEIRAMVWSKLAVLTRVVTSANVKELLAKAEKLSVEGLKELVQGMVAKDKGEDSFKQMKFKLAEGQFETTENALKVAGELSGSEKPGNNLELVCAEFLATKMGDHGQTLYESLELFVPVLERAYGVKIEVVKDEAQNTDE